MLRAVLRATVSPCSRATTRSAMSMPAEIPAEVSTLPSSTACSVSPPFTAGNNSRIRSSARRCVVARRPSSRPAWPSSSEPVQTDVSVSTCLARSPIQPTSRGLVRWARVPHPPGTTRMSSGGQSSSVWSGITFMPPVVRTGAAFSATSTTSNGDGSSRRSSSFSRVTEKTSNGPQKWSTSTSGNNTIPTRLRFMAAPLLPPDPEFLTSRAARRACPLDAQRSRARERLPQGLGRVLRAASGEVLDLLPAGDAGRDDRRVGGGGLHGRRQAAVAQRDGDVVVLALEAERAGHPAAAGGHPAHEIARPRERRHRRRRAHHRLLVAVPVQQRLAPARGKRQRQPALALAQQELLEEQALLAPDARVVGAQQVHPLVAQREQARGLEA